MHSNHYFPDGLLGIECGGTQTSVVFSSPVMRTLTLGPANYRLTSPSGWREHFSRIQREFPDVRAIGLAVAGARNLADHQALASMLAPYYPGVPLRISHDLESAFLIPGPATQSRMVIISGTGSCAYGRDGRGREFRAGGWGHMLGDEGSGYAIGFAMLRRISRLMDSGESHPLAGLFLDDLKCDSWESLIPVVPTLTKDRIAALARHVIHLSDDPVCEEVLTQAGRDLGITATICLKNIQRSDPDSAIEIFTHGGIMHSCDIFQLSLIQSLPVGGQVSLLQSVDRPGYSGALEMARLAWMSPEMRTPLDQSPMSGADVFIPDLEALGQSPTEMRHPQSMNLDSMSLPDAIQLFLTEDSTIPASILSHMDSLVRVIERISSTLGRGGRLIYAGAGTSGRLGILDASECPPTFRTPPEWVQGVIAGGLQAVFKAVEGAEDSTHQGIEAMQQLELSPMDVVVGIAASGRTPFVWGALHEARLRGSFSVLLTFNPNLTIDPDHRPDEVIAVDVGPELLTGSTRLKSGTATKLILNILTTLSMVRIGKVVQNLMVDLHPSNEKLRDRAVRILHQLSAGSLPPQDCRACLEEHNWIISDAWKSLQKVNDSVQI